MTRLLRLAHLILHPRRTSTRKIQSCRSLSYQSIEVNGTSMPEMKARNKGTLSTIKQRDRQAGWRQRVELNDTAHYGSDPIGEKIRWVPEQSSVVAEEVNITNSEFCWWVRPNESRSSRSNGSPRWRRLTRWWRGAQRQRTRRGRQQLLAAARLHVRLVFCPIKLWQLSSAQAGKTSRPIPLYNFNYLLNSKNLISAHLS